MKDNPESSFTLVRAAAAFAALGSEQRLNVLHILVRAGPDGMTIGTLGTRSGIIGSTLTHHMKILVAAGLATQVKHGRQINCTAVDHQELHELSEFLLHECCADCGTLTND